MSPSPDARRVPVITSDELRRRVLTREPGLKPTILLTAAAEYIAMLPARRVSVTIPELKLGILNHSRTWIIFANNAAGWRIAYPHALTPEQIALALVEHHRAAQIPGTPHGIGLPLPLVPPEVAQEPRHLDIPRCAHRAHLTGDTELRRVIRLYNREATRTQMNRVIALTRQWAHPIGEHDALSQLTAEGGATR